MFYLLTQSPISLHASCWAVPPAWAEWTPHYWGKTVSSPASHRWLHSVQWCLKKWKMKQRWGKIQTEWECLEKNYKKNFLPFCFCKKSIVLCSIVDLSILRGWPWPCSMVHSSLMSTLNWSLLFFSDLFREALYQAAHMKWSEKKRKELKPDQTKKQDKWEPGDSPE